MNTFDYFFTDTKESNKKLIIGDLEEISFSDLYNDSISLASYINDCVGENERIILLSHNSIFFITCYLAILKSGNVCVPLNPTIESANYAYIEELTQSKLLFISEKIRSDIIVNSKTINESNLNDITRGFERVNKKGDFDKETAFDENRLAEIIFTSGSTGTPKGVMLTHLNLRANTESILSYLKLTSNDSSLLVLPLYYCYGLSVLHTHLKVGASIVFNNNFMLLGKVIDDLIKYRCSGFAGVPSHFQMLLRKSKTFTKTKLPYLRYVTQAGGKLHASFIKEFVEAFPSVNFFVMYGQTEATARLSYLSPNLLKSKIGSIGTAIPGVSIKIIDQDNEFLKIHQVGEIVAKGNNIMKGYFDDIQGTKEVLKNGWLHTGDLGFIDEEGFIFITSRKKNIIKVGGNRISPKEIEEVIVSHSEVIDCTVFGVEDQLLGESVKAVIVINEWSNIPELRNEIMKLCREKLSIIKIPQIFEFSVKLNITSSGKKINSNVESTTNNEAPCFLPIDPLQRAFG